MANEEHLAILRKGGEVWNKWREQNPKISPSFSEADLRGVDLRGADLSSADFSFANLNGAYFGFTDLSFANLTNADLGFADFFRADLSEANLSRADLSEASLIEAQALRANFTEAIVTGACIEDWHINSNTQLVKVSCKYIYLKQSWNDEKEKWFYDDRRPSDPNQNFAPGEFTKLFQKALSTVDLIFRNGFDWEAFAYSFKRVQVEQGDEELAIQSIENKGDGVLVVRLNVSSNADKGRIQGDFMQGYELAHKVLDERYRSELDGKSGEIHRQQEHINQLFFLLSQKQEHNQEIEKLMAETPKVNQTFNIQAPVHGFSGYTETFNNFSPEQKQNLAEAAAEIQELLNQLAQVNPNSEGAIVEAVHQEIKRNPTLKARLLGALKAGGLEALKAIFAHPVFTISAETVKGWLEAE